MIIWSGLEAIRRDATHEDQSPDERNRSDDHADS
jgi:hypothetical protein